MIKKQEYIQKNILQSKMISLAQCKAIEKEAYFNIEINQLEAFKDQRSIKESDLPIVNPLPKKEFILFRQDRLTVEKVMLETAFLKIRGDEEQELVEYNNCVYQVGELYSMIIVHSLEELKPYLKNMILSYQEYIKNLEGKLKDFNFEFETKPNTYHQIVNLVDMIYYQEDQLFFWNYFPVTPETIQLVIEDMIADPDLFQQNKDKYRLLCDFSDLLSDKAKEKPIFLNDRNIKGITISFQDKNSFHRKFCFFGDEYFPLETIGATINKTPLYNKELTDEYQTQLYYLEMINKHKQKIATLENLLK